MKYDVFFKKPKKKGHFSNHVATFFEIEDAIWYESIIKKQGAKDIIIKPK